MVIIKASRFQNSFYVIQWLYHFMSLNDYISRFLRGSSSDRAVLGTLLWFGANETTSRVSEKWWRCFEWEDKCYYSSWIFCDSAVCGETSGIKHGEVFCLFLRTVNKAKLQSAKLQPLWDRKVISILGLCQRRYCTSQMCD